MIFYIIFFSLFFIVSNNILSKKDKEFKFSKGYIIEFILTGSIYISLIGLLVEKGLIEESLVSGRGNPIGLLLYSIVFIPIHIGISVVKKMNKRRKKKIKKSTKEHIVKEYREKNPEAKKCDCIRETGLSKSTVYKWWDS
ncbi:Uncharacterised protein [[Clostridium] sordellii]|uniref:hypothetical protein n=1 Tax=Paraclostridium sordellii TaxID=1505 RepID=UPI0005E6A8C8|nr:hypothetical protein [Paeniclostridium sordellii]CEP45624.1 Uncharacterised protein [[Clostridium] sordellii] [Paeniclostridium sordellii]